MATLARAERKVAEIQRGRRQIAQGERAPSATNGAIWCDDRVDCRTSGTLIANIFNTGNLSLCSADFQVEIPTMSASAVFGIQT